MEITGIAIQVGEKLKHKPIIRVCNKLPMAILQQLSKKPDIAWIRSEKKKKKIRGSQHFWGHWSFWEMKAIRLLNR